MTIEKHSDHDAVARELDSQIRQLAAHAHVVLDALRVLIEEARTSEIHTTLGFPSWTAYIADALDGQWSSMLDRDKRGAAIAFLAEQGMSQRAIAKVTGASKSAVQRELIDRCPELGQVMGLDGKTYPQPDVVHGGPPAEDIERDIALDKEVSLAGEQLMEHRWHWTMDESNPERVTIEQYAADCGVAESVVRIDVTAWGGVSGGWRRVGGGVPDPHAHRVVGCTGTRIHAPVDHRGGDDTGEPPNRGHPPSDERSLRQDVRRLDPTARRCDTRGPRVRAVDALAPHTGAVGNGGRADAGGGSRGDGRVRADGTGLPRRADVER